LAGWRFGALPGFFGVGPSGAEHEKVKRKIAGKLAVLLARISVTLAAYAAADADRTTATIAGWNPVAGDLLAAAGVGHRVAAAMFRDALDRVQ
jgi:hypothetical protein